jgi:hypothetical protein
MRKAQFYPDLPSIAAFRTESLRPSGLRIPSLINLNEQVRNTKDSVAPLGSQTGYQKGYPQSFLHPLSIYSPKPSTNLIPSILWNLKVHYRVHKSPPLVPNPEPDRSSPYHPILSKIHFNIVHSHMSSSSQWSLSFWLTHQYPICIPFLPHSCYMPRPSHPPWLDHSNYTWRRV